MQRSSGELSPGVSVGHRCRSAVRRPGSRSLSPIWSPSLVGRCDGFVVVPGECPAPSRLRTTAAVRIFHRRSMMDGVTTRKITSALRVGKFERTFEAELTARYEIPKLPDGPGQAEFLAEQAARIRVSCGRGRPGRRRRYRRAAQPGGHRQQRGGRRRDRPRRGPCAAASPSATPPTCSPTPSPTPHSG